MSDNFHKFLFLGVMIAIAAFANHGAVAPKPLTLTYGNSAASVQPKTPPLFVLEPPEQVIAQKLAEASDNQFVKAAENSLPTKSSSDGGDRAPGQNAPLTSDVSPTTFPAISDATFLASESSPIQPAFSKIGDAAPPQIKAGIALVADLKSGETYMSLGSDRRWPLASVTKLMTAAVAFQKFDMNATATATVTQEAFAADPTDQILKAGDTYQIADLLRIMLLPSSNVAAETIAAGYSAADGISGRDGFIALMSTQAQSWGMKSTFYEDPSGLSSSNQTTSGDMLLLAQKIYAEYPRILATTRVPFVAVQEVNSKKRVLVKSINDFVGRADFLGGKTGYTDDASGNLFSIFSYHNRPLFIIVLGTDDRFGDTTKLLTWFEANYK